MTRPESVGVPTPVLTGATGAGTSLGALATARASNDAKQQAAATAALEKALVHWKRLAELDGKFNRLPVPSNAKEPFSWTSVTPAVERDIEMSQKALRGGTND
jgi:hypothetical protein